MRKMLLMFVLAIGFCQQVAFAETKQINLKEKWVGLAYKSGEKPIVLPVLSDTEKECLQLVKEMNEITKSTVKIDRQVSCQPVLVK